MQTRRAFLAASFLTLLACGKDDNPDNETGFFTDEQFAVFVALGLQMNPGDQPPDIEGTFRIDPRLMESSSAPANYELVETTFKAQSITFSQQDAARRTLAVTVAEDGTDQAAFGDIKILGSSISGTDNAFTAFFLSEVTFDGHVFKVGQALSGNIVERGIENFQQINTVIDDAGHPGNFLVSKNTGDLFVDLNGLSKRVAAAAASDTK